MTSLPRSKTSGRQPTKRPIPMSDEQTDDVVIVTVAAPGSEDSDDSDDSETIIVEVQGRTETRESAGAPSDVAAGNIVAVAQVPTVTVLPQVDADPQLAITGNEARLGFLFSSDDDGRWSHLLAPGQPAATRRTQPVRKLASASRQTR